MWKAEESFVKKKTVGMIVLAVGVVCVAAGLMCGQYADVFRKAIFICLECIGIG